MNLKLAGLSSALFALIAAMLSSHLTPSAKLQTRADFQRPKDIPYPNRNPYAEKKAALGRALFFDPLLSRTGNVACATCHNPSRAWTDGLPRAVGVAGTPLPFKSPSLLNVAWTETLGWTGKFPDLEAVAFTPITGKALMDMPEDKLIERLRSMPEYLHQFSEAFEDKAVSKRNIEFALATFERSIVSGKSPFDRWVEGEENAIKLSAKRGFKVFVGKGQCAECHSGWAFTDGSFHDIGTAQGEDIGRGRLFPKSEKLRYAFKTPTLREIENRAPYMHDGSVPSLEKVIELYNRGGIDRPSRSDKIKPLSLTVEEKQDLLEFLQSLTDLLPEKRPSLN